MKENRITSGNPATAETSFRRGGNADLPRLRVLRSFVTNYRKLKKLVLAWADSHFVVTGRSSVLFVENS